MNIFRDGIPAEGSSFRSSKWSKKVDSGGNVFYFFRVVGNCQLKCWQLPKTVNMEMATLSLFGKIQRNGNSSLLFCLAFWIAIDWQNRKWILSRNRNSLNSWIRISKLLRKSTVAIQPRLRLHLNVHWTHIHPKLVQYIGVGEGVVCVGGSHLELHLELHPPTNSPTAQWTWTWEPPWSSSTNSLSSS